MSLLVPLGLAGLLAVPVIILFHMRHTTPPRRPAPSLRFWDAAKPLPAQDRRLRRPPLSWPLILQIAAVALLALALARPVTAEQLGALAPGLHAEPRHLILLLDGSTSMGAIVGSESATRWEAARQETLRRLAELRQGDVATVILMATRPLTFTATDSASLITLRERLTTLSQPGGRADLDGALRLAGDLFLPNLEREVVVISDGAASADAAIVAGVDAPVELIVAGGDASDGRANFAVVDISARPSPDGSGTMGLYAAIANYGPRQQTVPVVLFGDGLELGRTMLTVGGNGGAESVRWTLPPGMGELTVRVEQPDALPADNRASLLLGDTATSEIAPRILLLTDLPGALARALMAIENVQLAVEPTDNLDAIAAGGYDLVVLERAAPPTETLEQIGTPSLWVAPPVGGPFETAETVADPTVTRLRAGDPLLDGVDLAGATFGPTSVFALPAGGDEVVGSADGPLLFRSEVNGHPAVVLTPDPEASNLPKRVAFPVLVANLVAELAPDGIPPAVALGEPLIYEPRAATSVVEIVPPGGEPLALPVAPAAPGGAGREVVYADTGVPGAYDVTERDSTGNALGSASFVVNAGHEQESDLRANPALAATLATASGSDVAASRLERVDLWPLLALLALIVILAEWGVVLWRGVSARRRPAQGGVA